MTYEIRNMEVRSVDTDKREITGLAVPYNVETDIGGYKERFEKGAFGKASDVKLFYGHSEPIGLVTKGEESDEGYVITARISKTARGDEVYELLRDGVLNRFSVGFLPVEHRMDEDVVVRTKATLKEVSVVAFPAYEGAKVSEVRAEDISNNTKEDINMSEEIKYAPESEVANLRDSLEDLERRVAVFGDDKNENKGMTFRSGGDFLKALASGSQEARDFATSVDADVTRPGWVTERLRLKVENRPVINLFSKGALPASGNSIEYPVVSGVTGTVDAQVAEGDVLPYMEVAVNTATAPVLTYGGYSSISRQAIERSDIAYLETVLEYQVRQYAKATNKAVRDALVAGAGYNASTLAADTATGWLDVILETADEIDANSNGSAAEFMLVSSDVYRRLAVMEDTTGRPLVNISGQAVNALGSSNVLNNTMTIAGLTVVKDSALPANTCFVASSDAVKVFESAGAPFRLQDEDIIRLTKDFSLYGYMAVALTNPLAVSRVDVDLV